MNSNVETKIKKGTKCVNSGKEHMTCVMVGNDNPNFVISLECVRCIREGKQIKSGCK